MTLFIIIRIHFYFLKEKTKISSLLKVVEMQSMIARKI